MRRKWFFHQQKECYKTIVISKELATKKSRFLALLEMTIKPKQREQMENNIVLGYTSYFKPRISYFKLCTSL
jgi:hypothetical protein